MFTHWHPTDSYQTSGNEYGITDDNYDDAYKSATDGNVNNNTEKRPGRRKRTNQRGPSRMFQFQKQIEHILNKVSAVAQEMDPIPIYIYNIHSVYIV